MPVDIDKIIEFVNNVYGTNKGLADLTLKEFGIDPKHEHEDTDLAQLRAELDAAREDARLLRDALPPFAHDDLCELLGGNILGDASIVFVRNGATLTIGDFKRARAALATRASG